MNFCEIEIGGSRLHALGCGALWWPAERTLIVADLHLGKAERMARRSGALLPPYEVEDTLTRLAAVVDAMGPDRIVSLGDAFDDDAARAALHPAAAEMIVALGRGRDWVWVAGNHDPGDDARIEAWRRGPLVLRHIALPGGQGDISGHFHPKVRLGLGGRAISRRCFLEDGNRVILPAFGTYTGGLDARDPVFAKYFPGGVRAIVTGAHPCRIPLRGRAFGRAS